MDGHVGAIMGPYCNYANIQKRIKNFQETGREKIRWTKAGSETRKPGAAKSVAFVTERRMRC